MKIIFRVGDESQVRNSQCGDWLFEKDGTLVVTVRKMPDSRSMIAVAIHEAIEALLCQDEGITDEMVCGHDEIFEREREEGKRDIYAEPGDDDRAPYKIPHQKATDVERAICNALDLPWEQHEENVVAVWKEEGKI